jgi:hypothetical protein
MRLRRVVGWAAAGFAVAAVAKEMSKPPEGREWTGEVAGIVPYDFRPPTFERARSRWWNPEDDRLFVPQVFGVGWTVNLARAAALLRSPTLPAPRID